MRGFSCRKSTFHAKNCNLLLLVSVYLQTSLKGSDGRVARLSSAKAATAVRIRFGPPFLKNPEHPAQGFFVQIAGDPARLTRKKPRPTKQ